MWTNTSAGLPPEGLTVRVMDSSGHEQKLVRKGRMWWFPDMSMYVYFTPTRWRKLKAGE